MLLTAALFALFGLQDSSGEIGRLQAEVSRLSSELDRTQAVLQAETRPFCSAQIHVQGGLLRVTSPDIPLRTNLLSMVSTPSDCVPADILVTATYFTANETFVCSGTVGFQQSKPVQNTSVEFRPYEVETFLKWWDGATLKQQSLICKDFQGNEMRNPSDSAASLRLYVSVFPRRGGLATSEIQLALPRAAQRP
jgi:hypothetical protein